MNENLPAFEISTNRAEWDRHISDFKTVMMKCTRKDSKYIIPPRLNVLWLTTDMDDDVKERERYVIEQFLDIIGYDVKWTQTRERGEADLLFVSTDREEDVSYLIHTIRQGFLGLMPKYEVLVSGLRPTGDSPYRGIPYGPMIAGSDFAIYGMGMIHEYIMEFQDRAVKMGRHTTMILYLEGKVWDSVKDGMADNAYPKKGALRRLLKSREHTGGEARWVLAALDLLSNMRNVFVHTPDLQSTWKRIEEARRRINKLATEYGRALDMPPIYNIHGDYSVMRRWLTQLTFVTGLWIDKYLKRYPVKNSEISIIASGHGHQKKA